MYTINIESQQQKVTVTGNVDGQTLLKKLLKTGKHAELWPEKPPSGKEKKAGKGNDKGNDSKSEEEEEEPPPPAENANSSGGSNLHVKISSPRLGGGNGGATVKFMVEQPPGNASGEDKPPPPENKGAGGGQGGKKKKRRGRKGNNSNSSNNTSGNNNAGPPGNGAPSSTGLEIPRVGFTQAVDQINLGPPLDAYPYPPSYAPQQAYVVSYNAAHPTVAGAPGYYKPPSPYPYAYGYGPAAEDWPVKPQPLDSFEMLSDENPNGCRIV